MLPRDALVLQNLKGVGNATLVELIKFFDAQKMSKLSDITTLDLTKIPALKRASKPLVELFSHTDHDESARACEQSIETWTRAGIKVIVYGSAEYPDQLLKLKDPPALLFCKGNFGLLKQLKAIAVVGTRENTLLGEKITRKTVEYFSNDGFTIISGLALGIDAIAHSAALACNGTTVAVVVDLISISPAKHRDLAKNILSHGGLLVSENTPGTKVIPALFAKRDRIQAGLAMAVFAIETAVDGGTMHAVNAALAMSRPVYVPNAQAAGYPDLGIRAISGTQALMQRKQATPYTREDYLSIADNLEKQATTITDRDCKIGLF